MFGPNITGDIASMSAVTWKGGRGAFNLSGNPENAAAGKDDETGLPFLNFYASASNAIYGASNSVQPPAMRLLPCIKF